MKLKIINRLYVNTDEIRGRVGIGTLQLFIYLHFRNFHDNNGVACAVIFAQIFRNIFAYVEGIFNNLLLL